LSLVSDTLLVISEGLGKLMLMEGLSYSVKTSLTWEVLTPIGMSGIKKKCQQFPPNLSANSGCMIVVILMSALGFYKIIQ
jgi:hypothetical protein